MGITTQHFTPPITTASKEIIFTLLSEGNHLRQSKGRVLGALFTTMMDIHIFHHCITLLSWPIKRKIHQGYLSMYIFRNSASRSITWDQPPCPQASQFVPDQAVSRQARRGQEHTWPLPGHRNGGTTRRIGSQSRRPRQQYRCTSK